MTPPRLTRRDLLKAGGALAGTALLGAPALRALAAPRRRGRLDDIEHVVILIQENRSFDHYFGTYPAVRGFDDRHALPGVFMQTYQHQTVVPFHLDTEQLGSMQTGECTHDITHSFGDQHDAWHQGRMDGWAYAHRGDSDHSFMGYYTRRDLPYYYALADAFTLCDAYHCSVMASTSSNRLYAMTGMLDPEGRYGGPILSTQSLQSAVPQSSGGAPSPTGTWGKFSPGWVTYPEQLTDAGVSWKCYGEPDGNDEDNPLFLFQQYWPQNYRDDPAKAARAAKLQAGIEAQFPADFLRDAASGTLPAVSWLVAGVAQSEHPAAAPHDGENITSIVVAALMASPLWEKMALFVTYDENGGFFDHVPPPTPPEGTPGEFVTGHSEPIGLGFRVPMLVVSPFSRGGFVCRDRFDHTSLLRFLERRFDVRAANISDWRRRTVGDLTAAFNFARPNFSLPLLPVAPPNDPAQHPECFTAEVQSDPYPAPDPAHTPPPHQEPGSRPSPSGLGGHHR